MQLTEPIIGSLNVLWQAAGLQVIAEGHRPLWSGFMHSICQGPHPLESTVRLLPITDLCPSDMTCIK